MTTDRDNIVGTWLTAHPIRQKATLPPVPFQETPGTEKAGPCQLGKSQDSVDSLLLQLWQSAQVFRGGVPLPDGMRE